MTITIEPVADLNDCILAGRRAAASELIQCAAKAGVPYQGLAPEQMLQEHNSHTAVNGFDITPGIDAAIMETLAWQQRPAPPRPKRPWWRFWR